MSEFWKFEPAVREEAVELWTWAEDEHQWWPRTLWIDPGGTSGYCVIWFHPLRFLDGRVPLIRCIVAWEAGFLRGEEDAQVGQVVEMVRELGGSCGLTVGSESFVVRQLNMSEAFLSPVRIRAALKNRLWSGVREWDGQVRRRPLFTQSPADAKRTVTDERLHIWDLWTPGPDHARDATRHAILHLRKVRSTGGDSFRRAFGWEEGWSR